MAGSKSWFIYATNDGTGYAIQMDTSNGLVVGNGAAAAGTRTLPRGVKPRVAIYKSPDGLYSRRIPVQAAAGLPGIPKTFTGNVEGGTSVFNLTGTRGEVEKLSQPNTGLIV